jgi:hypothetical protein
MTRAGTVSHAKARRLGWERVDPRPWRTLSARWLHRTGWWLVHCGHPTANRRWALYAPDGRMHRSGGVDGRPDDGLAWSTLGEAMAYVATQPHDGATATVPDVAVDVGSFVAEAAGPSRGRSASGQLELNVHATPTQDPYDAAAVGEAQWLEAWMASKAYAEGFARGADPKRYRRRHTVDPRTHEHFRRGHEDGVRAAEAAERSYFAARLRR